MWSILAKIKQNLSVSILVSMVLGLLIGYYVNTKPLNILIRPLTILMVFPMMVNMDVKQLFKRNNGKIVLISQVINFIAIPLIAFGIGMVFFSDYPYFLIGFMLMAVLPTSGMTISWTGFTKGNINAALKITIIGLISGAILGPIILSLFFNESISIPSLKIFQQIVTVILVPLVLGLLIKRIMVNQIGMIEYNEKWKKRFPLLSSIGVILVIFIATSLKAKTIIQKPEILLTMIVPIMIFYVVNFAFTTIIGHYFCSDKNKTALVYGTVMRNLSVALAIAMTSFDNGGSDIALVIAVAYIFQVQLAALYIKVFNKLKKRNLELLEA